MSTNLSNRTVAIVLGSVVLVLTAIWAYVGGVWIALAVPIGFAGGAVALGLLQVIIARVVVPLVAVLGLGAARAARLLRRKE